jgi:predicted nucleic acid-binding Zn ribbon protein
MPQYSMSEAIHRMLEESNWKYRYQVTKIKEDWEKLMGKTVAKHTRDLKIHEGVLYIYSDVAALRNELSYNKVLLLAKLNQHFGETFLKDIVVR